MEITYSKAGDDNIHVLVLPGEEQQSIGKYGRMRRRYLKEHRPVLFSSLILSGKLYQHLAEIDRTCEDRLELIIRQMKTQEGVNERLKADDQMAWVTAMNSIRNRAEEIVLSELVYE